MGTIKVFNHPIKIFLLALLGTEALLLISSVLVGRYLSFISTIGHEGEHAADVQRQALLFSVVMIVALVSVGLYNRRLRHRADGIAVRVAVALVLGAVMLSVLFMVRPGVALEHGVFALALAASAGGMAMTRIMFSSLLTQKGIMRRVLILGAGHKAVAVSLLRRKSDLMGLRLVGFVPLPGEEIAVDRRRLADVGGSLYDYVRGNSIDEIIVAADERRSRLPISELLRCRTLGVEVLDLVSFLEVEMGKIRLDLMSPSWLAFSQGFRRGRLRRVVKRLFDLAVAALLLVFALPVMAVTALLIWLESGCRGPVLYRQVRVGEQGRNFELLKMRSMRTDAEKDGQAVWAQSNDPRVTRVGAFIRKYRIDELPQLFNVLRGQMSFVGPRPERPEFVRKLSQIIPYYGERHQLKPGLTGWAQICYPYGASEQDAFEKLQYDIYYVKNHSLFFDLMILFQTAEVVLWGRGAR